MEEELQSFKCPRSVQLTRLTRQYCKFLLSGVNTSVANALRRIMIAEVPTLAIDLVTIEENTSALHDEYLSHRLGLLPIDSSTAHRFRYREECSCADKCVNCAVDFSLNVECTDDETLTVTHFDITLDDHMGADAPTPVPRPEDASPEEGIVIAKLRKNQRIHAKLTAIKGTGKMHAKWIPVATASYRYEPKVELAQSQLATVPARHKQLIARCCPRRVFSYEDDVDIGGTGVLTVANKMACIFCDECVLKSRELGYRDLVSVKHMEGFFHFSVETAGGMAPELIVLTAIGQLTSKLDHLSAMISQSERDRERKLSEFEMEHKLATTGSREEQKRQYVGGGEDSFSSSTLDLD